MVAAGDTAKDVLCASLMQAGGNELPIRVTGHGVRSYCGQIVTTFCSRDRLLPVRNRLLDDSPPQSSVGVPSIRPRHFLTARSNTVSLAFRMARGRSSAVCWRRQPRTLHRSIESPPLPLRLGAVIRLLGPLPQSGRRGAFQLSGQTGSRASSLPVRLKSLGVLSHYGRRRTLSAFL